MSAARIRAAVIGVGAFGRHHARILAQLDDPDVRLVGLVDVDPDGPRALAEQLGVPLVGRVEDLPEPIDVASVAVPTVDHRAVAEPLLRRGVHCLVEKPLAGSSADAEALVAAAEAGGALLQVGLVERFNPVMAALDRLGAPPAFLEVHRLAPYSARSRDIGVVMDMMIHDLDLVNHLVGEEPSRVEAVGVSVLSDHEDLANARLTFPSGCVANITASRVSHQRMRRFRIFSPEGYLSLDYDCRQAILVRTPDREAVRAALDGGQGSLPVEKLPIRDAEPLREEIRALVRTIREGEASAVGGGEGLAALRLAERILADIRRRPDPSPGSRRPSQMPDGHEVMRSDRP